MADYRTERCVLMFSKGNNFLLFIFQFRYSSYIFFGSHAWQNMWPVKTEIIQDSWLRQCDQSLLLEEAVNKTTAAREQIRKVFDDN